MSYFKRIALIKSNQVLEPPEHTYVSDLTELCYLGAQVEKDVELVTIPISPYTRNPLKAFEKKLKQEKYDFVGISSMTAGYKSAREYARIAKAAGAFVTMGGYHPTALTDDVLSDSNVDGVVRGEGDLTFRDLILHGPSEAVSGLSFKKNGEMLHNPDRALITDMDSLPLPLRRIRPHRFGQMGDNYTIDSVYMSRGCIAKCTFCANDTVNKGFRARSPEHFVEELELIHDKNIAKVIKFWDSIFLFDPKRVERIVELMFKRNLTNFLMIAESRSSDVIRCEHLLKDMRRLGFEKILIGIESPDKETFKRLRKGGSITGHEKAIRLVQATGMVVEGLLIIGHPHETAEDIKKYPEFARKMDINHRAFFYVMTPYPGTQIFREYHEKNLIESYDWNSYCNLGAVVRLENLTRSELRNLFAYCYGSMHGFPYMLERQSNFPLFMFQLVYTATFMMYLHDVQPEGGITARNEFLKSFFSATFGEYRKRTRYTWWEKLYRLFSKSVTLRFQFDEKESCIIRFQLNRDETILTVRPYEKKDGHLLTVTLDDFDYLHRAINMADANALTFLFQKKGKLRYYAHQLYYYIPTLSRVAFAGARWVLNVLTRYLFSSNLFDWKAKQRSFGSHSEVPVPEK